MTNYPNCKMLPNFRVDDIPTSFEPEININISINRPCHFGLLPDLTWLVYLINAPTSLPKKKSSYVSPQYSPPLLASWPVHKIPLADWNFKLQHKPSTCGCAKLFKRIALLSTIYQLWPFNSHSLEQN